MWQAILLGVMWNLWYERNRQVFDGVELPAYVIKEHILWTLFDWMQALGGIPSMSFVDSLTFCVVFF